MLKLRHLLAIAGTLLLIISAMSLPVTPASAQGGAPTATTASPTTTTTTTTTATTAPTPAASPTAAPAALPQAVKPAVDYDITSQSTVLSSNQLPAVYILGVTNITTPTTSISMTMKVTSGEAWVLIDPAKDSYKPISAGAETVIKTWTKAGDGVQIRGNNATYELTLSANTDPASYSIAIQDVTPASAGAPAASATPITAPAADVAPGDTAGEIDGGAVAFLGQTNVSAPPARQALVINPWVALGLLLLTVGGGAYLIVARLFHLPPFPQHNRRRTDVERKH